MPTEYAPLYSRLAELAAAYVLPAAWSWLPVDVDCRQLVDDVGAWEQLSQQFPAEDLQNSGVASRANGQLVINPRLVGDESGFIVLRNAEGEPFDVVTGAGCLYGQIPALRMHLDRTTKQALSGVNRSFMYGTFSMLDTVLLRSLGVAVTPVARMETLDLPCLNRLLGLVGGTAEGDIPKAQVALPWDEPDDPVAGRTGRMQVRPAGFRLVLLAGSLAAGDRRSPRFLAGRGRAPGLCGRTPRICLERDQGVASDARGTDQSPLSASTSLGPGGCDSSCRSTAQSTNFRPLAVRGRRQVPSLLSRKPTSACWRSSPRVWKPRRGSWIL